MRYYSSTRRGAQGSRSERRHKKHHGDKHTSAEQRNKHASKRLRFRSADAVANPNLPVRVVSPKYSCYNELPFFYGWTVVAMCVLAIFYSAPGETFGLVVFMPSIMSEISLTQATIDVIFMVTSLLAAVLAVPIGIAYRNYSAKKIVSLFLLVMSISCVVMSFAQSVTVVVIAILGLRFAAQSVLYVGNIVIVSSWFQRRIGLALGLVGFFHILLCVNGFPPLASLLIVSFGWRRAYWFVAGLGAFIILPLFYLFTFDEPSKIGLQVDGKRLAVKSNITECEVVAKSQISIRTLCFMLAKSSTWWTYFLANFIVALVSSAIQLHIRAIFSELNISIDADLAMFSALGITFAFTQLIGGYLLHFFSPHIAICAAIMSLCVTLIVAAFTSSVIGAVFIGIFLGISEGALRIATNVGWALFFEKEHLGLVQSTSNFAAIVGQAIGPLLLSGTLVGFRGAHGTSLLAFLVLPVIVVLPTTVKYILERWK